MRNIPETRRGRSKINNERWIFPLILPGCTHGTRDEVKDHEANDLHDFGRN